MRTLSKQTSRISSSTNRFTSIVVTRRTVDVFIIEGRNLRMLNGMNRFLNPYIRLKFGTNKKYRSQVRDGLFVISIDCLFFSLYRRSNQLRIPNGINHSSMILLEMNFLQLN